jgi:aminopeptidase YwaD
MRRILVAIALLGSSALSGEIPPFLREADVRALASEISGEAAKRNLEFLSRQHRMRGSRQFHLAAEHIAMTLKSYGFTDAHIERLPADGTIFYGTQRSRPAWNADFAELWDLRGEDRVRLASWESMPITLAQDSSSAEVTAELVDAGGGTSESDYSGRNVRGKLVLASAQPGAVVPLAVGKYGAAGIVSYAQNQRTAWWGENENLVRWGHLDTFAVTPTFAFMVSLKQARDFQQRLRAGEVVRLHAIVRAGREPGFYEIPTATIPGSDLAGQEIIFSCHLDHPRPGANDNASGCAAILEVARTIRKLIGEKRIQAPRRTIRFVWPAEIEGTLALLNGKPELAGRIKAAIHLDMVGGGPETKAVFHVTRGPGSLPSFVNDVAEEIGRFVNRETAQFAMTGAATFPFVAPEGGKEPLLAELVPFTMGSDHEVYTDSSWSIPAIYLNDWPDRYIHTNMDVPANIDPTKLQRAAFIAAACGYFLAAMKSEHAGPLLSVLHAGALRRTAETIEQARSLDARDAANRIRFQSWFEQEVVDSLSRFIDVSEEESREARGRIGSLLVPQTAERRPLSAAEAVVYRRNPALKGPMSVFGYDYFNDKFGSERAKELKLLEFRGLGAAGGEYGYELLNLVNGKRTVKEVRDDVSAIYGPIPLELVAEYLTALESIGVIRR